MGQRVPDSTSCLGAPCPAQPAPGRHIRAARTNRAGLPPGAKEGPPRPRTSPDCYLPHLLGSVSTHQPPDPTLQGHLGAFRAVGPSTHVPSSHTWDQDVPKTQEGEGPVTQGQW